MRLRLFQAPTIAAAIAKVRQDLGPEALILRTRRVADGVEVTAALDQPETVPDLHPATSYCAPDTKRQAALQWHGVPAALAARLQHGSMEAAVAASVAFRPIDLQPSASPVLLAGPPGAGKTLTAARLATRLVMAGTTPLVITADGRRAGATEQLAAFTRLLGLTLIVANQPASLTKALTRRTELTPVLIDGAGLDPFDPAQRGELLDLAGATAATIVLVLPAGLDSGEAAELAQAFAGLGACLLVITRMDLTRRIGSVLAAATTGLPLAEAGIGPGAADGLVPFTPALIANRLMRSTPASHISEEA